METAKKDRRIIKTVIATMVLLHALHDFCSFISADGSITFQIVLGSIQFVILILYFAYLLKTNVQNKKN